MKKKKINILIILTYVSIFEGAAVPIVPPAVLPNMAAGFVQPASPVEKPRTVSVSSQDSPT